MKQSREKLSWTPATNTILVMIGDAKPHTPGFYKVHDQEEELDWKEEVKFLLNKVSLELLSKM